MTIASNPRLLVVWLALPLLLAAGAAVIPLMGLLFGVIALVIAAFIAWTLAKMVRRQMRTRIEVDEDGARFVLYGEETLTFPWPAVRLAGLAVEQGKRGRRARRLFVYREEGDHLMTVPEEFERFDELAAEVRRLAPVFHELELAPGEPLKERLRALLLAGGGRRPPAAATGQPASSTPGR